MSLAGEREAIAELVSAVPGVRGSAYRPRVISAGAAWPLVGDLTQDGEVPDFLVTWRLMIVLPSDEMAAAKWFDEQYAAVVEALEDFAFISNISPASLKTEAGDVPVMVVTMRKEA